MRGIAGQSSLAALKIALLAAYVVATNHGVAERWEELWGRDGLPLIGFALIWGAGLLGIAAAAYSPALWMRLLWAAPLAGSAFAGELAYAISGAHLTLFDLRLLLAERAHWGEAAEIYRAWSVAPLLRAALGVVAVALPPTLAAPRWRALLAVPLLPVSLVCGLLILEQGKGTRALPEQFNALAMVTVLSAKNPLSSLAEPRQGLSFSSARAPLARHAILIVDESIRADYLDLNGACDLTPTLLREAKLANFGLAVAGNNCSLFSNLILRYGGRPERIGKTIRSGPSIWSFASGAGFRTVYLDAQKARGTLQNGMTVLERREIDEFVQFSEIERQERDVKVARKLRELARSEASQFVYANLNGLHFPYSHKYPRSAARFLPDMLPGEPLGEDRERFLNSYRNGVAWHIEGFFGELLAEPLPGTVILYTSDHGQNLLDRGPLLQCNSSDPHVFEGLVPIFAIASEPELALRFREAARINGDRASHFDLFPTLLELFGYDPGDFRELYGDGLLKPLAPRTQAFSYGPVAAFAGQAPRWREMPRDLRSLLADPER